MDPKFQIGQITNPVPISGKAYVFKLQDRVEREETLTLESPSVKPKITQLLVDNRKQLLAASYQAIAMNEAKIENFLAKKVVDNPNELSGARPAPPANANVNTAPAANANTTPANVSAVSNAAAAPAANSARPAANSNANAKR